MTRWWLDDGDVKLACGDALEVLRTLPDESVDCVVTSPPYADARDDVAPFPSFLWAPLFHELARVVTGGMLWNVGRVWRDGVEQLWWHELIEAARILGWGHWDTLIWVKPNANPIHGRIVTNSHEYVLAFGRAGVTFNEDELRTEYEPESLARMSRRWRNGTAVKGKMREAEGRTPHHAGARARSIIVAHTGREKGNEHPTPMAEEVADDLVRLASWPGQTILDPFVGSGTTCLAARKSDRYAIGIDVSETYLELAHRRLGSHLNLFAPEAT